MEKHYPNLLKKLAKKKVRESLVEKARKKVLTSSRAFMDNVVPVITRAKSQEEKEFAGASLLRSFVLSEDMPAEDVLKKFERFPSAREMSLELIEKITDLAENLIGLLGEIERAHDLSSFPQKARMLEKTLTELRGRLATNSGQ